MRLDALTPTIDAEPGVETAAVVRVSNDRTGPARYSIRVHGLGGDVRSVDVPGDQVPAQPVAHGQRTLQVHAVALAQATEIRAAERFFADVEGQQAAGLLHDRQATAVNGHALTHRRIVRDRTGAQEQPAPRPFMAHVLDFGDGFDNACKHGRSTWLSAFSYRLSAWISQCTSGSLMAHRP